MTDQWLSLDDMFYLAQAHAELGGPEHEVLDLVDDDTGARYFRCCSIGCMWGENWYPPNLGETA